MKTWIRLFSIWALLCVVQYSTATDVCGSTGELDHASVRVQPESISLLRLIVTPERYESKRIVVHGFVYLDLGSPVLYLSRESRTNGVTSEAVNIISRCDLRADGSILEVSDLPPDVKSEIDKRGHAFVFVRGVFLERKAFGEVFPRAGSIIYEAMEVQRQGMDLN